MKITLKISSLILAICMTFSAMTGIVALAEGELTVVDWNADSDFITIDFSHAVSSLDGKVTLTRTDGTTTQNLTSGLTLDGAPVYYLNNCINLRAVLLPTRKATLQSGFTHWCLQT